MALHSAAITLHTAVGRRRRSASRRNERLQQLTRPLQIGVPAFAASINGQQLTGSSSAAVFDPAFPGRNMTASGPRPAGSVVDERARRMGIVSPLERWALRPACPNARSTVSRRYRRSVLGGVPGKVLLADRMGCLKGGVVANRVIPTPEYVRFAAHYGFAPDFCEANDPQSKGIVENLVG